MHRSPWERRLVDLESIFESCCASYLDPERFRRNTNNFLTTARTVTFLIQKQKSNIPGYEGWYQKNVVDAWQNDTVMTWAKDSRNIIEKQGDLELHSSLKLSLVFSYLEEEDLKIDVGVEELLRYGVKKLIRLAQKRLPTAVSDAASVKIVRTWITSNLKDWEFLNAMLYVYRRHFDVYKSLCYQLNQVRLENIREPGQVALGKAGATAPSYVKVRGLTEYKQKTKTQRFDRDAVPDELRETVTDFSRNGVKPESPEDALAYFSMMATKTFEIWGNHVPMLHLFDKDWNYISMKVVQFDDQADKFLFWRAVGEDVVSLDVGAVVWIGELWQRQATMFPHKPIRNLPILGEALHVEVLHRNCTYLVNEWSINREKGSDKAVLGDRNDDFVLDGLPNYFAPICRAMGGELEKKFNEELALS
jgi:hypothetical protein